MRHIILRTLKKIIMGCFRVLLCIIFPPLAVIDKGCGSIIIVFILTCLGWIPGVIAALIINNNPKN
ncbi:proteolipid membrane potential modulator [Lutibacter oceani]|uniref:Proteolipid membrane potential modulator n=2 Tax=Lutibacter TaxID=358023 RepID=A0A3D9RTA0_9FLAO|nr:proteolipid membrane potential modulator [Lutibacter oceani]